MKRYTLKVIPTEQHLCPGPTELVDWMFKTCRTPHPSVADFMQAASAAAWMQDKAGVRTDHPDNFVADLVKAGFITVEDLV